mgnify:CR=1 FL=1
MEQLYSVPLAPLVREVVKLTGLKGIWAVLASLVAGLVVSLAVSVTNGTSLEQALAVGILTGFVSNLYQEAKTLIDNAGK